jgi:HEAT repeat protein
MSSTSDWEHTFDRVRAAKRDRDVDYLIAALRDPEFRKMAARYLGDVGDERAAKPLLQLLDAADDGLRATALRSLGRLRVAEALPRATELASKGPSLVRSWAVSAIGEIGSTASVDLLIAYLEDDDFIVRRAAAVTLGELGDPRAVQPLRQAKARERWPDRSQFRKALRQIARAESARG